MSAVPLAVRVCRAHRAQLDDELYCPHGHEAERWDVVLTRTGRRVADSDAPARETRAKRKAAMKAAWGVSDVQRYLAKHGVTIPKRTDCGRCFFQRIGEWWDLWREHPDVFASAEADEGITGHTYRSPGRDSWPASLRELRSEFGAGRVPRDRQQISLLEDRPDMCRACSL